MIIIDYLKKIRITEGFKNKYSKMLDINRKEYDNITNAQKERKKLKDKLTSYQNVIVGTGQIETLI